MFSTAADSALDFLLKVKKLKYIYAQVLFLFAQGILALFPVLLINFLS